jgi:DNA-binding Lrp family transcriptional regulator
MINYDANLPSKHVYDSLDRELIGLLRNDGRAPLSKLAKLLKVSRGTVQNRLDRLLSSGAILGFTVRVRDDYGLDTIRALMMVEVTGRSTSQIIQKLRGIPELVTLHTTNGAWDLVVELQTSSLAEFDRVLRDVRMIDGILNSETSILLSSV